MRHFAILLISLVAAAGSPAATADDVLSRLDSAAAGFNGMTADLTRVTYTKVLDEKDAESGTIALRKQGKNLQGLIKLTKPDEKVVGFEGKKAEIYYPKLKVVEEYDLGKHGSLIDQFLLVGFGSGKALAAAYTVKYAGEETVAGQKTHKLELTPTTAEVKDKLRRVDLWIADNGSYPVQQRFVQPSGDYYLATYSNVRLNPGLGDDALKLKLPGGVKRQYPQR
jgi:outer membrane lipoprotein-sorting protein